MGSLSLLCRGPRPDGGATTTVTTTVPRGRSVGPRHTPDLPIETVAQHEAAGDHPRHRLPSPQCLRPARRLTTQDGATRAIKPTGLQPHRVIAHG